MDALLPRPVEQIIRNSIEFSRSLGYQLCRDDWGVEANVGWIPNQQKRICGLGAVLLEHRPIYPVFDNTIYVLEESIQELLQVPPSWVDDFIEGWDEGECHSPAARLGHTLACEYIDSIPYKRGV
jgi:hypothetical protein